MQNFGIVIAFGAGFLALYLLFTEINTGASAESSVMLFKRGAKVAAVAEAEDSSSSNSNADEEKEKAHRESSASAGAGTVHGGDGDREEEKEALAATPAMTDVFSWHHLNYVVPVHGGRRQLLDDVSGYVAPGKLTALMGESGAGKVRHAALVSLRFGVRLLMDED